MIDSFGTYLLRAFVELLQIWVLYISKSPDQPMGKVDSFWARLELQDPFQKGNLPHMHCAIFTDDDLTTQEGLFKASDRIRGFVDDIVRPSEADELIRMGVYDSVSDISAFKDLMRRFLPHRHHNRCFIVVKKKDGSGVSVQKRCKVTDNWETSKCKSEHTYPTIPLQHTQEAIKAMQEIGVCAPHADGLPEGEELEFIPLVTWLKSTQHIPPSHGDEGIISPVIGALVAINPNSDNCQLTNSYFISRYLAKYISKIDEYGRITITPPTSKGDPGTFNAKGETLMNTKITGNKMHQAASSKRGTTTKSSKSLAVNVVDTYLRIFGYPTIMTNLRTVKVSTDTFECRAARERKRKPIDNLRGQHQGLQTQALTPIQSVPAHHARKTTPNMLLWRMFTDSQITKAYDDLFSPLTPDSVTRFGFRPPEIRFVMNQVNYHRWFKEHPLRKPAAPGRLSTLGLRITKLSFRHH